MHERWEETTSEINFTSSSQKAWATINRPTGRSSKPKPCPLTDNSIASVLVNNGKWNDKSAETKAHSRHVLTLKSKGASQACLYSPLSKSITCKGLYDATLCIQNGKSPGGDQTPIEFLKQADWLEFEDNLSNPKPHKPANKPESHCLISLLRICHTNSWRIILSQIDIVEHNLPHVQAGIRKN